MYKWMRNTHLLLGLGFSLFLLMYALSALQMSHPAWFDLKPAVTRERISLDAHAGSAHAVAGKLMREHGLRGDVTEVKATAAAFRFRVVRLGENVLVDYSR